MRVRQLLTLGIAVAVPALSACDRGGDAPGQTEAEAETTLAPVNQSGITGTIEADHSGDQVTIALRLEGLQEGQTYPAHIHGGRCAAGGPVEVPLGRLTGRSDGTGSLTTRVDAGNMGEDRPFFVQVHAPDGAPVACADLPGHQGGEGLTERLEEPADTGAIVADTSGGAGDDGQD